jgi:Acetyl-coenzyme A synthetase N-terminus
MSALPLSKPENISNLLNLDEEYAAPAIVADNVLQKDWNAEREHALKDPESFWGDYARRFEWSQPWNKVLEWDGVHHQWFTPTPSSAIAPRSSGWARTAPNASLPTASFIAWSAASQAA